MITFSEQEAKKNGEDSRLSYLARYLKADLTNGRHLYSLCKCISNNMRIAKIDFEDIYQEFFIKSMEIKDYDPERGSEKNYLGSVFKNKCIDFLRQRKRDILHNKLHLDVEKNLYYDTILTFNSYLHSKKDAPDYDLKSKEKKEKAMKMIRDNLSELSLQQMTLLIDFYWEKLSYKQLAEKFSIPLGTVKSSLAVAKNRLKKKLTEIASEDFYIEEFLSS